MSLGSATCFVEQHPEKRLAYAAIPTRNRRDRECLAMSPLVTLVYYFVLLSRNQRTANYTAVTIRRIIFSPNITPPGCLVKPKMQKCPSQF
jgi:hypothetical protein